VTEGACPNNEGEKREKAWGMFHLYLLISSALIIAMWGVIIRGGEPPPPRTVHLVERPTVILFLVDGAIRRYAHYEERGYPEQLSDLPVKYIPLGKEGLSSLDALSYSTDPAEGYRLALIDPSTSEVIVVLSPQGIVHMGPPAEES